MRNLTKSEKNSGQWECRWCGKMVVVTDVTSQVFGLTYDEDEDPPKGSGLVPLHNEPRGRLR